MTSSSVYSSSSFLIVAQQQTWNDPRTTALVQRATERRLSQIADTALVDYKATAHGYVTFLAQFGEGFPEPPKIVKADELGLEVYWRAPDLSKQRIMGRRDTLLLPTDINYHRDHLGIVQNNFRNLIRIGEGDEVKAGMQLYSLDDDMQQADLNQNNATLANARQTYERAASLSKTGSGTQANLDAAVSALRVAEARVNSSQTRLARRTGFAPVHGTVQQIYFRGSGSGPRATARFAVPARGSIIRPAESFAADGKSAATR